MTPITRTILLWCPDWPVTAAVRAHSLAADAPIALVDKGVVFACSAAARRDGVRRGQRLRDAQVRCQEILVFPYEAALDSRAFEPVIEVIEQTMPGVQLLRPGICAMRAKGPARYYGGEEEAALWLLDALDELGIHGSRVGIADGPFTAEHAARSPKRARITIVPEGTAAEFLAPLSLGVLDEPALATLLQRLGIRTLGEFSRLDGLDVEARFGEAGARLHALASGLDSRPVISRVPPEELDTVIAFEPALDRVDQVAFGFRASADRFIQGLVAAQLVCTSIRIEIDSDSGDVSERSWLHPRSFTAADVVDRLRWQLQGSGASDSGLSSGVTRVRVVPESVDAIGNHEHGLWGTGHDERIHHGLSRVQSMLGHGGVLMTAVGGGRTLRDREKLTPWGDREPAGRLSTQPWPGQLPTPAPGTVFEAPLPAAVFAADGSAVDVDDRGVLSAAPSRFSTDNRTIVPLSAWAGPWPIAERWWDAQTTRRANRFQMVDETGAAWLLVLEDHLWWAEARYD
ncbi:DNA polymerase Y family protein [Glaciihabitans sp. UYNi722]|uniref:DNA polymerase Y family protein n=1 Tax=Glaciihabitans sp. UYNi722 TaxID=3156344 RepID=UPI0033998E6C